MPARFWRGANQAGKVGKVYCANDRVDAVKIARIYLSGLAALVWQPDPKTLERREVFSAYQGSGQREHPAETTNQSDDRQAVVRLHGPNENKMSDGGRGRASPGVEM